MVSMTMENHHLWDGLFPVTRAELAELAHSNARVKGTWCVSVQVKASNCWVLGVSYTSCLMMWHVQGHKSSSKKFTLGQW